MREVVMARGRNGQSVRQAPPEEASDGIFARILDTVLANPIRSGAVLVAVLTTSVISANALFFQTGRHPSPFFSSGKQDPKPTPVVKPVVSTNSTQGTAAVARTADKPATATKTSTSGDDPKLIADIQRALISKGLYQGPADGKWGAKTKQAVLAFQQQAGMPATGEPTQALLARLTIGPAPAAAPKDTAATAASADDKRIRAVQSALNQIGYGPVKIDGQASPAMSDAIRRFELDNGMPMTGAVSADVIKKLQSIGALGSL